MSFFLPPTAITVLNGGTGLSEVGSTGQVLGVNPQGKLAYISIPGSAGGTVTSVSLAAPPLFTITNSPVTASGTLTLAYTSGQSLPVTFGGTGLVSGGATGQVLTTTAPNVLGWTTPAASGTGTVTSIGITPPAFLTASSAITTNGNITLSYNSGTAIPINVGGTGLTSVGAPGQVLTTNGPGTAIVWTTPTPAGTGTVTSVSLAAPSLFTVTNSPITASGTLTLAYTSGQSLPVTSGGTGLVSGGATGQVLTTTAPNVYGWTTPAAPGNGTVTSVGIIAPAFLSASSAITTSGNITLTLSGVALPVVNGGTGLTSGGATGQVLTTTAPNVYGWTTKTTGTVTSVSLAAPPLFTITNSPVTASGTLTLAYTSGQSLPVTSGGTGLVSGGATGQVLTTTAPNVFGWTTPAPSGTGTVTSVGITPPAFLTASSAITSSGNITLSYNSGTAIPINVGGTGLTAVGAPGQVLTTNGPGNAIVWTTPTIGTVTSVGVTVPSFLTTNNSVTTSGSVSITYNTGTPLPFANGGTGLTTTGSLNQVLTSNGTSPVWGSTITSLVGTNGATFNYDPALVNGALGVQICRANYGGNVSNQMLLKLYGADEGLLTVGCLEADGGCNLYVGIYGDWTFGNSLTNRFINHTTKTRILRDGFSAGNFTANHPFQIQCTSGSPRAIQMGYQDSTDTAYIQSMDNSNVLKPLLIRTSNLTLSSPLGTSSGGTGLNSVGTDGFVLTAVSGSPSWQPIPAITNNFSAITVSNGATFNFDAKVFTAAGGVQIGREGNAQVLQCYGQDDTRIRLKNSYEPDIWQMYMGIYGDWVFGSDTTPRFMNHYCKTRILRDGVSAGNFAANHPFQIQTPIGGARALQMGWQDSTETGYIQSMDFLNNLKPLLIRSSALTLSSPLGTGSGGTGLSTVGANGQVLTVVGGQPSWAAIPAITNNFTAITVDSGAAFTGGSDTTFPNTEGVKIGKLLSGLTTQTKTVNVIAKSLLRETTTGKTFQTSMGSIVGTPTLTLSVFDDSFNFFPMYATSPIHIVRNGDKNSRDVNNITHALELRSALNDGFALMAGYDSTADVGYITAGNPSSAKDLVLNSAGGNVIVQNDLSCGSLTTGSTTNGKHLIVNDGGSRQNNEDDTHPIRINAPFSTASLQMGVNSVTNEGYVQVTGNGATQPMYINFRNDGKTICSNIISKSLGLSGRYDSWVALTNPGTGPNDGTWQMDYYVFGSLCFIRMSGFLEPNTGFFGPLNFLRMRLPFNALNEQQSCGGLSMQYNFTNYTNPIEARIEFNEPGVLRFQSGGGAQFGQQVEIAASTGVIPSPTRTCNGVSFCYKISPDIDTTTITGPTNPTTH